MRGKILVGIVLLSSSLFTACNKADTSAQASAPPPTPVQVQTLQNTTLEDSTEYVGTLQAEQTVNLMPQTNGRIEVILVKPGDRVTQGQPLFRLTPEQTAPQFQSAQANVNAAIASRNTALQQLRVAQSQLASAQAQYDLANVTVRRSQFLVGQGAVAQSVADQNIANLKTQTSNVKTARDQVKAAVAAIDQANANIRAARANAASARVALDLKQVTAPIAGSVGNITLKVGDYVTTGQALTTINQNNNFDLQIPIPLNHAAQLRPGIAVQLLDPNTNDRLGTGNIYFVATQADPTVQTILTRARFPNSSGRLRDAQYVKARVIWQEKPGVLVPTEAVLPIGGQNFVFVAANKTDNGKTQLVAHQVPVTLGNIQGQSYQVLKGLKPGDKAIVAGVSKLKEGAPIALQDKAPQSPQSQS